MSVLQNKWAVLCCCRLPSPLTPAKRSREARLGGASTAGSSLASPSQKLKTESTSGSGSAAVTGAAAAAKAAAGPMPGDDLPPVIAPPGRCADLLLLQVLHRAWHGTHILTSMLMSSYHVLI